MSLLRIEKWCLLIAISMALVSLLWRSAAISLSIVGGAALSFASFMLLRTLVERALRGSVAKRGLLVGAMMLKLAVIGVVLWVVILHAPVHIISFMAGLSALIVAVLVEAMYAALVVNDV